MSVQDEGGLAEVIRGLRVLARLHASGDFIRIQDKPEDILPLHEGWGTPLRAHIMACIFVPAVVAFILSMMHVAQKLSVIVLGMMVLFLFVTCIPRMLRRFRVLSAHPQDYSTSSDEDRIFGGVVVLGVSTLVGIGCAVLMMNALLQ